MRIQCGYTKNCHINVNLVPYKNADMHVADLAKFLVSSVVIDYLLII